MLYAKIAVGLPVSGPFDYMVPDHLKGKIELGKRAWINFGPRRIIGYVVELARKSEIKNLKPLLEVIDDTPVLSKELLLLTKDLASYYSCSWGEAIESAIPEGLRNGVRFIFHKNKSDPISLKNKSDPISFELIHDLDGEARWDNYIAAIKLVLEKKLSVIVLLPDISDLFKIGEIIGKELGIAPKVLYRKQPNELEEWLSLRGADAKVVIGTRSAVFAPLSNLGLIIIDNEEDMVYKQDQVPHYHARLAAFMRAKIEGAGFILGSRSPSLESYYLSKRQEVKYTLIPRKKRFPEINIVDSRHLPYLERKKKTLLSRQLEDAVYSALNAKGKVLLFLNRKGFATSCACSTCGKIIKCPRCNINLVYYFKEDLLSCHYCNFKIAQPKICPECNSGYIKFSGAGTEKIESELSRIFPQARINILEGDNFDLNETDIAVATSAVIRKEGVNFDLVGVLGIDNALNRLDFRSTEKAFGLLTGLSNLTEKKLLIQTASPLLYCFQALLNNDPGLFYNEELKQRRQLGFPPYKHLVLLKLRGKYEDKIKGAAEALFNKLSALNKNKNIEVVSVNSSNPPKLRGNYYWQVLIRSGKVIAVNELIKNSLKDFRHSGIIVTIDVDPV